MVDFDYDAARAFLREKDCRRQRSLDERFENAWADFESISAMIIRDYPVTGVYQWGSLLHRDKYSEISDIDIAVTGNLTPEEFFSMLGKAMAMSSFSVDLVELDKIHPSHADSIKRSGRRIYPPDNEA